MSKLREADSDQSIEITAKLRRCVSDWEQWALASRNVPEDQFGRYAGRGEGIRWKRVLISDDRSGPVKDIKTSPNMSKAGRVAATIRKIVEKLLVDPACQKWRKAALQFLHSTHSTVESLQWAIGDEAFYHLAQDLTRLLKAGMGQVSGKKSYCTESMLSARRLERELKQRPMLIGVDG